MNERYQPNTDQPIRVVELSASAERLEALASGMRLDQFSQERVAQYDLGPVDHDLLFKLSVEEISANLVEILDNDRPLSNEMTSLHRVLPTLRASSSHAQKQSAVVRILIGEFGYGIDRRLLDVLATRIN